jgi:GrpB-like predicted nucleotidyltransferase (UPF0157 family)
MPVMSNIEVVEYDPRWPAFYQEEASAIREVLADVALAVHHVGSTAVPRLAAKPVIDLLVEASGLPQVDSRNQDMLSLGYRPLGENGIPGRRYFVKGGNSARTHNIHIFQQGHPEIEAMLAFRDYLRAHPRIAARYGRLKIALATQHPDDIRSYVSGKDPFIKERLAQARSWRSSP